MIVARRPLISRNSSASCGPWNPLEGVPGHEAHGGFFQSLMRTMTSTGPHHSCIGTGFREDVRTDPATVRFYFFGGCAPYFDVFFRQHLDVQTSDILVDSLRLLNFFDITPAILPDERCCGHDLLWSGIGELPQTGRLNVDAIADLGVKKWSPPVPNVSDPGA